MVTAARSILVVGLVSWGVALTSGCEGLRGIRRALHGEAEPDADAARTEQVPPGDHRQVAAGKAGLAVEVDPPLGISILLDGAKVATQSPFTTYEATPGGHSLLVRGMGFLPVVLPLQLKEGDMVRVPVSLRARPPQPEPEPEAEPKMANAEPMLPPSAPAPAAPPPPRPAGPPPGAELPVGSAVDVSVVSQPAATVVLDGQRSDSKILHIHRSRGTLLVGAMRLVYNASAQKGLELTLPNDNGTWSKDGAGVASGSVVRLTHGFTRLRRQGPDGSEQGAVIRRWDTP